MSADGSTGEAGAGREAARPGRVGPGAGLHLPPEVVQHVGSPGRTALVVAVADLGPVQAALDRVGCQLLEATAEDAFELAGATGSCDLVLIDQSVLALELGAHLVHDLRAFNPGATVLLLAGADLAPRALLGAMRAGVHDVVDPADAITLTTTLEACLRVAAEGAERVLAIGAHPDDVEIGCAGALLDHRRRGDSVAVLTLSHGDVGGDQGARMMESTAAAASMGAQLMLADLPDTRLDAGIDTIRLIEAVVGEVDPTIVYVHSKSDNHQDHRAVHIATVSATRRVPQVFAYQSPSASNDFSPTKFIPIDAVVTRKVEVLGLFASQNERAYLDPELVIAGARYWARSLAPRARYAEPFEVIRSSASREAPRRRLTDADRTQGVAPVVPIAGRAFA